MIQVGDIFERKALSFERTVNIVDEVCTYPNHDAVYWYAHEMKMETQDGIMRLSSVSRRIYSAQNDEDKAVTWLKRQDGSLQPKSDDISPHPMLKSLRITEETLVETVERITDQAGTVGGTK